MKHKVATMKEEPMRDFNNILQKVSCEHSPAFTAQMIKYSRNLHILKGEKTLSSVSKLHHFSVHFLIQQEHLTGKAVPSPC